VTRRQRLARRADLIRRLSDMSRDWSQWTVADWNPLEAELKELNQ
jgi:hypothetical protein